MPGAFVRDRDEWFVMRGWSRWCNELPGDFLVAQWSRWPAAGVGVACGRGLLAFDIDRNDLVEPIKAVLPPAVVAKRGRKGETLFYRGDTAAIRSRGFKIDKLGVMDLIADGKQTVLPPTVHPSGEPYGWTTPRTLADTPLADLTEVTEAHVEAVIAVLVGFGYDPKDQSHVFKGDALFAGDVVDTSATSEFFRKLNDDALANLDAWVPRLGLTRLVRQGRAYRSVAEWRPSNSGNPIGKRPLLLSINPKGIVDYGDGDKGYTPLNLVMAANDMADWQLDKAAVWLGECIGYDFAPAMVLNQKRRTGPAPERPEAAPAEPEDAEGGYVSDVYGYDEPEPVTDVPSGPGAEVVTLPVAFDRRPAEIEQPAQPAATGSDAAFEALTHVPGLVGELVDWMAKTSRFPSRTLALAAALVFVGTLAGRLYKSESGLRTNLYTLGLAPSGFGKDHARKCLASLEMAGGFKEWFGGDGIASASGMRRRVEQHASIMWVLDEFGGFMKKIGDPRAPQHTAQIRDNLLKYYGSAGGTFRGEDYAGERGSPCYHPNVGLYGTSTPIDFWGACRSLSVGDGLLARFLIFSTGADGRPPRQRPSADHESPPTSLIEACRLVATPKLGGNLANLMDGSRPSRPMVACYGPSAHDLSDAVADAFQAQADGANAEEQPFYQRVGENAEKIALILAIGVDPDRPVLTTDLLHRGREIASLCLASTLREIRGRLADNDRQREHIDVRRWIEEAGPVGISKTELARRVNGRFDARRRDDILKTLQEDEKIIDSVLTQSPKGGAKGVRFIAAKHLGAKAS